MKDRLENGNIHLTDCIGYEAHGIGKKKMKIKRFMD